MVADLLDQYSGRFVVLSMHVNEDGFDTPWGQDRLSSFYGFTGGVVPTIVYDGAYYWDPEDYIYGLQQRLDIPTDVTIELYATEIQFAQWQIAAEICIEAGGSDKRMRVYVAQGLDDWPNPPSYSRNTVKQVAPTQDVDLDAGACTELESTLIFDDESMIDRENIIITVWAQATAENGPAEVYQAAQIGWPFPEPPPQGPALPEYPRDFELPHPLFTADWSA